MKRRTFLQSSLAAGSLSLLSSLQLSAADDGARKLLSWRRYVCKQQREQDVVSDFLKEALLPGLTRAGIKPVGVFVDVDASKDLSIYTFLCPSTGLSTCVPNSFISTNFNVPTSESAPGC